LFFPGDAAGGAPDVLTPDQELATRPGRHLSVTANAGSGKTRVLVERYLRLVLEGYAPVQKIVALTYTEKAAGELKRRIAARVTDSLLSTTDPDRITRLEAVRAQLPSAFVGTIHAFCSRLLREHPIEAGVDAGFIVLEGLDRTIMLEDAVRETFYEILRADQSHPLRDPVFDLLRTLGKGKVLHVLSSLIRRREMLDRWSGGRSPYDRPDTDVLAAWDESIREFLEAEASARDVTEAVEAIMRSADGKKAPAARAAGQAVLDASAPLDRAFALRTFAETVLTTTGGVYRAVTANPDRRLELAARRLAVWRGDGVALLGHCATGAGTADHTMLLSQTRVIMDLLRLALERYARKKQEAAALDFEDLQLLARNLLSQDAVRRQLARTYSHILVDEYQDTNHLQYEILLPLLDDLRTGNLFIVGDPKQSIYGFRNADVEVFYRTCADILRTAGTDSAVVLGESFRPLRDLVAFVNLVFGRLLTRTGSPSGGPVSYDPLVRARANEHAGAVELLIPGADGLTEGARIAKRILAMLQDGSRVFDDREEGRPVEPGDIAVLLRSRTHLPELEEAFIAHGIPYRISGGVGYFQTQDILDFYNYFAFVLNPEDDAALAGVLRSPCYGVSDAELLNVSVGRTHRPLWDRVREPAARSISPSIGAAADALSADLEVALTLTVPELIRRINRRTHYREKVAGTSRGIQAAANIEKLLRMSERFDEQGMATLYDFTARLRRLIDEEEQEGQGAAGRDRSSVQIMTIHAAKGLEFPVVILPHLHRRPQFDREPFVFADTGIAFTPRAPEDEDAEKPPIAVVAAAWQRASALAEERRVLYVAATRARDVLVLSGDPAGAEGRGAPLEWVLEALGLDGTTSPQEIRLQTLTEVSADAEGGRTREPLAHELTVRIRDGSAFPAGKREHPAAPDVPAPRVIPGAPPARPRGEIYSATRIRTYLECPSRYYLTYRLGYREEHRREADEDELRERSGAAELTGSAELLGTLFHGVMRTIESTEASEEAVAGACASLLSLERPLSGAEISSATVASVTRLVRGVLGSEVWASIRRGGEARTEFTVSAPFGSDYIVGTIDRMFMDEHGTWTVVDYKTDRVPADAIEPRARLYLPQVQLYGLLVSMLQGADAVKLMLLFAHHPDRPYRVTMDRASIAEYARTVTDVVSAIAENRFPPRPGGCEDCPFPKGTCERLFSVP
jgi:ATP-dependent helicase/nuclease subunit A